MFSVPESLPNGATPLRALPTSIHLPRSPTDAFITDLRGRCVENTDYGAPTCVHNGFLKAYRQAQSKARLARNRAGSVAEAGWAHCGTGDEADGGRDCKSAVL
jgi:hypothetical protein